MENIRREISDLITSKIRPRKVVIITGARRVARNDAGQLWENYVISERLKYQQYKRIKANNYFWRTYDQQEIDFVEEHQGLLTGIEFKWSGSSVKPPATWRKTYPLAEFMVINPENYLEWLI